MKRESVIAIICILLLLSCSPYPRNVERVLAYSGENRSELEKVLQHYSHAPEDSLKFQAALFLIENMPGHYTLHSRELEEYWKKLDSIPQISHHIKKMLQTVPCQYPEQRKRMTIREDVKCIRADYLISRIDRAFKQWEENPWLKELDFETFQNYLLPYRIANEPLDYWRDSNSMFQQKIEQFIEWNDGNLHNLSAVTQHFSPLDNNLPRHLLDPRYRNFRNDCTMSSMADLFAMYMIGIPAAIDFTPGYSNHNSRHYWTIPIDSQIKNQTCEQLGMYGFCKVYRKTYAHQPVPKPERGEYIPQFFRNPFQKDVTNLYIPTTDIRVKADIKSGSRYAFLCIFNDLMWRPVAWGELHRRQVCFREMGRQVVYLPVCYSEKQEMFPISHPFILHKNGETESLRIIPDSVQNIVLKRKYSLLSRTDYWTNNMTGGHFEAANRISFADADTVGIIDRQPDQQYNSVYPDSSKQYRFWRFVAPKGGCYLAELQFLDSRKNSLQGKLIGSDTINTIKFFDNNPLTISYHRQWTGMDFGQPKKLSEIRYLPRNDANGIFPGDTYELLYYSLPDGWISAGVQTATTDSLRFEKVPAGTLYWLRNHTCGQEERIFTYENGEVHFW